MAHIDWLQLCETAFLDNCDRLCVIGVINRFPVPALPIAVHQLMLAGRVVDLRPGEEVEIGVSITTPSGLAPSPDDPRCIEISNAGEYVLVTVRQFPLNEEGVYRFSVMKRRNVIFGLAAAAAAMPTALRADDAATWTGWWERSKKYTLAIADAMPAADYNFAPFGAGAADGVRSGDGARTFGQLMQHIGQAEGFYLGRFGKGGPAPTAPTGDTSKDATLKYLNAVLDWSVNVVKQLTPADLTSMVTAGRGNPMTGLDALLNAMVHTAHTRGYSDMYLRNKGVKPPTYQV